MQRYGHLTVLKIAAVRHLGFVKFEFFTVGVVKRPILHQHTKFHKDQSNRCGDIAIFVIFKMAVAATLDMCHHAKLALYQWIFKNSKF